MNQTLSRTVLTSITTLIVVVVLFIWGGIAINDFVLIMLLGIIIGTYSSMFVAAPVATWLHYRRAGKKFPDAIVVEETAPEQK